jgi:RNA polymerase sigma factor (TIGR02999 family)
MVGSVLELVRSAGAAYVEPNTTHMPAINEPHGAPSLMSVPGDRPSAPITLLLKRWASGDPHVEDDLFRAIYDDLQRIARRLMRGERADHTIQPTALVNESYLRLKGSDIDYSDRHHFLAVATRAMRRFLVDHARARGRLKRAGARITLDNVMSIAPDEPLDLVVFDNALEQLEAMDARKAELVQLRHLAGLSIPEIAAIAGVSERTVKRDLQFARAFLRAVIEKAAVR